MADRETKESRYSLQDNDGNYDASSIVDSITSENEKKDFQHSLTDEHHHCSPVDSFETIPSEIKEERYSTKDERDDYPKDSTLESGGYSYSPKKQQWMTDEDEEKFKILDPDDPLMKRFQDALKSHLLRIDNKLADEISELVRL